MEQNYYSFLIGDEEVMVLAYDVTEAYLKAMDYAEIGVSVKNQGIVDDFYAECGGFDII